MTSTHPGGTVPGVDGSAAPFAGFNLSEVFSTVARAAPDHEFLIWRGRRFTFGELDARATGLAHHLVGAGLGLHTERSALGGHECGQDMVGLYLRNGNEYLESMVGCFRARAVPFNVNFRYVDEELAYLFRDAGARALVFHAEFADRVAALRDDVPGLEVLIQVPDASGNDLLPGAVAYEDVVSTPAPPQGLPTTDPDDVYAIYTGGTTGMPKAVLWRQDDIYVSAMGGQPFGAEQPYTSYAEVAASASGPDGAISIMMTPPFMHGAAQWATFHAVTSGGRIVLADNVVTLDPAEVLTLAVRERCVAIPVVGDAIARPLVEELERHAYDLSGLAAVNNGGAPLSPSIKDRLLAALPHILVVDTVGSSETGIQMTDMDVAGAAATTGTFSPGPHTTVVDDTMERVLEPGEDATGWLAQQGRVPLGYLGDRAKTERTFPTIDKVRYAIPGDRARRLENGQIELLGRAATTINTGGEKVYAEEVERALAAHPDVRDVIVVGRPSQRWGNEVVAVVQLAEGSTTTDADLLEECGRHVARYKVPKAVVRRSAITRSPSGKADYRWAREQVE
ncbi:acyl-CoA synthetase [Nocardioides sp.]|uniref:acyl-CoA synthetase n=1 Tax=Nocardioides sp. TaxID=35761 RepID=UPI0027333C78|nr:acyl-CoA synthetase [Nocardioides sp.]MDP3894014.1 acyl-CoA synthetase [Nocardioides sp.]